MSTSTIAIVGVLALVVAITVLFIRRRRTDDVKKPDTEVESDVATGAAKNHGKPVRTSSVSFKGDKPPDDMYPLW